MSKNGQIDRELAMLLSFDTGLPVSNLGRIMWH